MKKLLFGLVGACMLMFFASCEKQVEVNDAGIIGKWKLMTATMIIDGQNVGSAEVVSYADETYFYELTEDHEMYYTWEEERIDHEYMGHWSLFGKTLETDEWGLMKVEKLTSSKLVLHGNISEGGDQIEMTFEFKRL